MLNASEERIVDLKNFSAEEDRGFLGFLWDCFHAAVIGVLLIAAVICVLAVA